MLFLHTKKLSEYNFQVEVDVDVLGKIFENSLNDIDDITKQIEEGVSEFDFSSKRKKEEFGIDELDFNSYEEFITILKDKKQNLPPLSEDIEWRNNFINKSIESIKDFKNEIQNIEDEINKKILLLYEINEEDAILVSSIP